MIFKPTPDVDSGFQEPLTPAAALKDVPHANASNAALCDGEWRAGESAASSGL